MTNFLNLLSNVFSTLGAPVFIPLILFIICKIAGVTTSKAFRSALLCAIGLEGFTLVINSYTAIVAPVVNDMVESSGVNLPCLDTGWQSVSVIAYSTKVGILFIGIALVLQLVLFLAKWTDVFMASDLWNNYSFMVWGSLIYAITNNMWLAMACMVVQLLYILLFSEIIAKRWSNYYQYPNCCMTAPHHMESVPFALGMNWVLNKIGLNKWKVDAASIQKKFGLFGEPMVIGLIIGLVIGIVGCLSKLGTLAAWGSISATAVSTAAIMVVFPKVGGVFASAFTALTDAFRAKAAKSGEGREWYLAINDAAGYGETNTLTTGVLLIPVILVISFFLPGNIILPMADLCALPYCVETYVCVSKGNVPKSMIMGAIWFALGMIIVSNLAPVFTQIAVEAGFALPQAGIYIMSFAIMCRPFMAGIFYAFLSKNPIIIAAVVILYFVCYFLFKKNRQRVYDWIEANGEKMPSVEATANA